MKLTNNFTLKEFRSNKHNNPDHPVEQVPLEYITNVKELARNLQILRNVIDKPIIINSGYRTEEYNEAVGGAKNSYHKKAMAADIRVAEMKPKEIKKVLLKLIKDGHIKQGGVIIYDTFVHYDIRGVKYRDDRRTK